MASASKRKKSKKKNTMESAAFQRDEIILWVVLAFSIILCLSNFGIGGSVGNKLSSVFFGLFGLVSYIFPIGLVLLTAFGLSNKGNKVAWLKVGASILFLMLLCLFMELTISGSAKDTAAAAFTYGKEHKSGGGFFGGLFTGILLPAFGLIGSYVIDIIGLIITLVIITERSAFRGMQKGSQKVYHVAKEENTRRREQREERQQKRRDRVVEGVAMDTSVKPVKKPAALDKKTSLKKNKAVRQPDLSDAMNEINIDDILETPPVSEESHVVLTPDGSAYAQPQEIVPESAVSRLQRNQAEAVAPQPAVDELVAERTEKRTVRPRQSETEIEQGISGIAEEIRQNDHKDSHYVFPPVSLLQKGSSKTMGDTKAHLQETANKLQQTLKNFGVNVTITNVSCGPSVTRYELQPEMGVKVSKIVNLADDIKLNLAASDIRIEAPIPGKAAVGIEVPNKENVTVAFRELIESEEFKKHPSDIAFAAGKDIAGKVIVADIAKMPHLLIAGATGSGKSVCINTIIMSILYKADPEDVKLIMIDPKVVELSVYNGIPHLLIPVVTDPKKASGALNWAVAEMTNRYKKFTETGVRNIEGYNKKVRELQKSGEIDPETIKKMPQIVIIIDELADLMMVAPGEVEDAIVRLSQLARAAGIHLVIATQRPSVNVITGLIKANVPSRIAFSVSSGVDSRTIIDMNGAEKLLGKGDMLFYPAGYSKPVRVQGAFISDNEISDVVTFLKENEDVAVYDTEVTEKIENKLKSSAVSQERDEYFEAAARFVIEKDKASIGMLQRMFKIGFNRAARIVDQLSDAGIVGPEEGTKPRKVLMSSEQLESYFEEYL